MIFSPLSSRNVTDGAEPFEKAIDNLQWIIDNYGQHETRETRLWLQ